jgi:hypothetical protein
VKGDESGVEARHSADHGAPDAQTGRAGRYGDGRGRQRDLPQRYEQFITAISPPPFPSLYFDQNKVICMHCGLYYAVLSEIKLRRGTHGFDRSHSWASGVPAGTRYTDRSRRAPQGLCSCSSTPRLYRANFFFFCFPPLAVTDRSKGASITDGRAALESALQLIQRAVDDLHVAPTSSPADLSALVDAVVSRFGELSLQRVFEQHVRVRL